MTDNRTRLVNAAQNAVQRSGLKGLSFRTLADEIGIKSSSVHYYFPEKADLAQTLIERYTDSFFEALSRISTQATNLRGKVEAFIAIFEEVGLQNKVCLCVMLAAELESLSNKNKLALQSFFHDMELWLVSQFDAHPSELETSLSSADLARTMMSGLEGALLTDRVAGNTNCMSAQKTLFLSMV